MRSSGYLMPITGALNPTALLPSVPIRAHPWFNPERMHPWESPCVVVPDSLTVVVGGHRGLRG